MEIGDICKHPETLIFGVEENSEPGVEGGVGDGAVEVVRNFGL